MLDARIEYLDNVSQYINSIENMLLLIKVFHMMSPWNITSHSYVHIIGENILLYEMCYK